MTSSLSGLWLQGWVVKWMKYMKLCRPLALAYWILWWPLAYLDLDYKDTIWNAWTVKLFQYFWFHVDLQLIWTWITKMKCKNKYFFILGSALANGILWWPPAYLDLDYKDKIWNAWIVKLFQYFLFHVDRQLIWTWITKIKCKNK